MDKIEIAFQTEKLQAFYGSPKNVARKYGYEVEKKLRSRLDDLEAAQSLQDMRSLPGRWEELTHDRFGQFSARLHGGYRLIVKSQKQPPPAKADGGLDWHAIDSIFILEVVDYHD